MRIERLRHQDLDDLVDRQTASGTEGSLAQLLTTVTILTYPTAAGAFYAGNPTYVNGAEVEGGVASYSPDASQVIYAYNLGTKVPPEGTRVVAHAVGGRWVFRYDG
ncbi:MAG: hypothetical protein ACLQVF_02875 [Isosphaeraceae bacterium]